MRKTKAILLCGGLGTRLQKNTSVIPKSLLPVYNKPMVYYPLDEIRNIELLSEVIIITSPGTLGLFQKQLENETLNIIYKTQQNPTGGIAEALKIAADEIKDCDVWLFLGDNLFWPSVTEKQCFDCIGKSDCTIFTKNVKNPSDYGVAIRNLDTSLMRIIEKPKQFVGNEAVTGVYYFSNKTLSLLDKLQPSERGQLEITDFINIILKNNMKVNVKNIGEILWLDAGTPDRLLEASNLMKMKEDQNGK